jgi:prevent-host-death family protein
MTVKWDNPTSRLPVAVVPPTSTSTPGGPGAIAACFTRGRAEAAHLRELVTNSTFMTMKIKDEQVPASEFKAKCLALFDEVENRRRSFIVTKRGRPVARVIPLPASKVRSLEGSLLEEGDLLAPVDVEWESGE